VSIGYDHQHKEVMLFTDRSMVSY